MANEMTVQFQANLTADPEVRTVGDREVCSLRLAHNTRTKRGDQWQDDETWYIDASVWARFDGDRFPGNVAASLSKGDSVEVQGRLKREPWESRKGSSGIGYRLMVTSIGPSLLRATAQLTRNEKQGAGQQGGSGWAAPQGQQGWGGSAQSDAGAQDFGGFDDEQPF